MLYNGTDNTPDYFELRLSDNFAGEGENNLQLTAKVYNINEGRNLEIMKKCEVLEQYSRLVSMVREAARTGELTELELKQLFDKCIDEGILPDFLKEYGREAVNMLFEEFTQEEMNEIYERNGYEKGCAEERERINMLNKQLFEIGRIEDLVRSTTDEAFQQQLLKEFNL